jgi:transcription elongation factor GreA
MDYQRKRGVKMSAADKKTVLTYAGLKDLEEELRVSKTIKRKEIAAKIKEARAQGDLSENAEYDAAKEEQGKLEARIIVIEKMLRNASVIDEDDVDKDVAGLGSTVTVLDMEFNDEVRYTIVGSAEADPLAGKISNESPVGSAILGRKAGDVVEVEVPAGVIKYKLISLL